MCWTASGDWCWLMSNLVKEGEQVGRYFEQKVNPSVPADSRNVSRMVCLISPWKAFAFRTDQLKQLRPGRLRYNNRHFFWGEFDFGLSAEDHLVTSWAPLERLWPSCCVHSWQSASIFQVSFTLENNPFSNWWLFSCLWTNWIMDLSPLQHQTVGPMISTLVFSRSLCQHQPVG